jgi:hypothetical protein
MHKFKVFTIPLAYGIIDKCLKVVEVFKKEINLGRNLSLRKAIGIGVVVINTIFAEIRKLNIGKSRLTGNMYQSIDMLWRST